MKSAAPAQQTPSGCGRREYDVLIGRLGRLELGGVLAPQGFS